MFSEVSYLSASLPPFLKTSSLWTHRPLPGTLDCHQGRYVFVSSTHRAVISEGSLKNKCWKPGRQHIPEILSLEVETGAGVQGHPWLHGEFEDNLGHLRYCLKKKKKLVLGTVTKEGNTSRTPRLMAKTHGLESETRSLETMKLLDTAAIVSPFIQINDDLAHHACNHAARR